MSLRLEKNGGEMSEGTAIFIAGLILSIIILIITTLMSFGIVSMLFQLGIKDEFGVFVISSIILNSIFFGLVIASIYYEYERIKDKYEREHN
jgi:predicted permease